MRCLSLFIFKVDVLMDNIIANMLAYRINNGKQSITLIEKALRLYELIIQRIYHLRYFI